MSSPDSFTELLLSLNTRGQPGYLAQPVLTWPLAASPAHQATGSFWICQEDLAAYPAAGRPTGAATSQRLLEPVGLRGAEAGTAVGQAGAVAQSRISLHARPDPQALWYHCAICTRLGLPPGGGESTLRGSAPKLARQSLWSSAPVPGKARPCGIGSWPAGLQRSSSAAATVIFQVNCGWIWASSSAARGLVWYSPLGSQLGIGLARSLLNKFYS